MRQVVLKTGGIALSLLAILLLALVFASRTLAARRSELTYFAGHDGNFEIYLLDTNRGLSANLTHNPDEDTYPAWSPDGSQMAFYSHRDGRTDLYLMRVNGGGLRRLVASGGAGAYPAWSRDGQWIVFVSIQVVTGGIYRVRPDGSALQRLNDARAALISWSPDSQRIAFTANCDNNCDIFMMNANGSGLRQLTRTGAIDVYPVWSPDSQRIAFMSNRDGNFEVYVLDADCDETAQIDGCVRYRLTHNRAFDGFPDWSPDGRWIAFSTDRDNNFEIYALPADCYRLPEGCPPGERLTNRSLSDVGAVWSPDGSQLAFESATDAYIMDADGSHLRRVAQDILRGQELIWRP